MWAPIRLSGVITEAARKRQTALYAKSPKNDRHPLGNGIDSPGCESATCAFLGQGTHYNTIIISQDNNR